MDLLRREQAGEGRARRSRRWPTPSTGGARRPASCWSSSTRTSSRSTPSSAPLDHDLGADDVGAQHLLRDHARAARPRPQRDHDQQLDPGQPRLARRVPAQPHDVAKHTTTFVQRNQANLTTALDVLQPGLRTAARYAPEFPCLFRGLVNAIPLAESAVGGKQPGLGVLAQFLPPRGDVQVPEGPALHRRRPRPALLRPAQDPDGPPAAAPGVRRRHRPVPELQPHARLHVAERAAAAVRPDQRSVEVSATAAVPTAGVAVAKRKRAPVLQLLGFLGASALVSTYLADRARQRVVHRHLRLPRGVRRRVGAVERFAGAHRRRRRRPGRQRGDLQGRRGDESGSASTARSR